MADLKQSSFLESRAVLEQFSKKNCSTNMPDGSGVFINVEQLEQFFGSYSAFFIQVCVRSRDKSSFSLLLPAPSY